MPSDPIAAIQRYYPRIYLACHVDHVRRRSTIHRLSPSDSSLLAHLDEDGAVPAGELARHLGIAASTLSAAVQRLEDLGYLTRRPRTRDRRVIELRLTQQGGRAMAATSVLDRRKLGRLFARLSLSQRRRALAGLRILAEAADRRHRSP